MAKLHLELWRKFCRSVEFLKFQRLLCALCLACLAAILLIMLLASAKMAFDQGPFLDILISDIGYGPIVGLIGIFLTFVLFVCPQRSGALRALYEGYIGNFLHKIVQFDDIKIILIDPGVKVVKVSEGSPFRERDDSDWIQKIQEAGFSVDREQRGDLKDPRLLHVVRHENGTGEIGIDFCRNLFALRSLIQNEQIWKIDKLCGFEHKYDILSNAYYRMLKDTIKKNEKLNNQIDIDYIGRKLEPEDVVVILKKRLSVDS